MLNVVENALDNTGNAHVQVGEVVFFKQLFDLLCLVGTRGQKKGGVVEMRGQKGDSDYSKQLSHLARDGLII
ncbi:TPA: hypothetical protein N3A08_001371 [Salmonella enterica subsp. salamae serovar 9,46:z4,z24:z39:z42]|nr:hypothetical protein [Salmonella enterica subsp. salamae serovar 9,46:z4,z24:z39:z42]